MTEREVKELIGHMVLQMREAEMELDRRAERIAALEVEITKLKGEAPSEG